MNSKATQQLSQVRAELRALENFAGGGLNAPTPSVDGTELRSVTGDVVTRFESAAEMAADTASLAAASGIVALRAIAAALALAPADLPDKDFAGHLHALSVLRAPSENRIVSTVSFSQYVSLIRRCEKLAFDFSQFKGGINALQAALRDRANEKKALEKGQDVQTFLESKAAARAAKKADAKAVVTKATEAAEAAKAEAAEARAVAEVADEKIATARLEADRQQQAALTAKAEAEAAKAEVEEVKAEAEAAKAEIATMAPALDEAAATIAGLTAENEALKAEVTRLQGLLAKRGAKRIPA